MLTLKIGLGKVASGKVREGDVLLVG